MNLSQALDILHQSDVAPHLIREEVQQVSFIAVELPDFNITSQIWTW
jgi:hypothetical protein